MSPARTAGEHHRPGHAPDGLVYPWRTPPAPVLQTPEERGPEDLVLAVADVDAQHLAVQEQQGTQGLVVGGRRHLALVGQHAQERLDLRRPHVARMPQTMPTDEKPHPIRIQLFGAEAIVHIANPLPNLVHQACGLQGRSAGFHGAIYNCLFIQYMIRKPRLQGACGVVSYPMYMTDAALSGVGYRSTLR